MKRHDYGDLIELSIQFADLDGEPKDPSTVALKIILPSGGSATISSFERHPSELPSGTFVGYYRYDLAGTYEGTYSYRWEATGAVQDAIERQLAVRATPFYP